MKRCVLVIVYNFLIIFCGIGMLQAQTNMVFEEVDGLVAVEAEHFIKQKKTDKRMWHLCDTNTPLSDNEENFSATASGNAYMKILPDTRITHADLLIHSENFSNVPGVLAVIEYQVYFNNPGRYYMWARCWSTGTEDNGVHVGINGTWPVSGQRMQWCQGKKSWRWESRQRTEEVHCGVEGQVYLDVPSTGIHTIAFSLREDGFRFDKWIMTKDPDFERPEDAGPAEKVFSGTAKTNPVSGSYRFVAVEDFEDFDSGEVPYYKHKARKALAINAAKAWKREKFAAASTIFEGHRNYYNIELTTLSEFDGECTYRVLVNNKEVGVFINPSVHLEDDYKPIKAVFRNVRLSAGDKITVESNSHTNGLIPEGEGTAWARGRWTELECIPSSERSVIRAFPGRVAWSAGINPTDNSNWLNSPWALAMFRAAGLSQQKVVYFGYNNHTNKNLNETYDRIVKGTFSKWGGYNDAILFNEIADTDAAVEKLIEEIKKSTESDPLWLVASGSLEAIGRAIEKVNADDLRFVTFISHDNHYSFSTAEQQNSKYTLAFMRENGVQYKKINLQNSKHSDLPAWTSPGLKRKAEVFEFLKDHRDDRMQWLWNCHLMTNAEENTYYDFSDAGLAYWLITGAFDGGDEYASPMKMYDILDSFINGEM